MGRVSLKLNSEWWRRSHLATENSPPSTLLGEAGMCVSRSPKNHHHLKTNNSFLFLQVVLPTIANREELSIRVCFSFSTKNQIPQINIGTGRVIYHIKAFSVVIRMTFKIKKNLC